MVHQNTYNYWVYVSSRPCPSNRYHFEYKRVSVARSAYDNTAIQKPRELHESGTSQPNTKSNEIQGTRKPRA